MNWIEVDKLDATFPRKNMENHSEMLCYANGEYLIGIPYVRYGRWVCESEGSLMEDITHCTVLNKPNEKT